MKLISPKVMIEKEDNRIGRFSIHEDMIRYHWRELLPFFAQTVVIAVQYRPDRGTYEYMAYSLLFDVENPFLQAPTYDIEPSAEVTESGRKLTFKAVRSRLRNELPDKPLGQPDPIASEFAAQSTAYLLKIRRRIIRTCEVAGFLSGAGFVAAIAWLANVHFQRGGELALTVIAMLVAAIMGGYFGEMVGKEASTESLKQYIAKARK